MPAGRISPVGKVYRESTTTRSSITKRRGLLFTVLEGAPLLSHGASIILIRCGRGLKGTPRLGVGLCEQGGNSLIRTNLTVDTAIPVPAEGTGNIRTNVLACTCLYGGVEAAMPAEAFGRIGLPSKGPHGGARRDRKVRDLYGLGHVQLQLITGIRSCLPDGGSRAQVRTIA